MTIKDRWRAELLRLTFIGSLRAGDMPRPIWAQLTGQEPDSRTEKVKDGALVEEGVFNDKLLHVSQDRDRVDILLVAPTVPPDLPDMGSFVDVAGQLTLLVPRSLERSVSRIAFGAVLHIGTEEREQAYELLSTILTTVQISPETREFLYQINRPADSSVIPAKINRLCKWAAVFMKFLTVPSSGTAREVVRYATRFELDFNTDAEFKGEIAAENYSSLIQELVGHALTAAENGDRP